MKKLKLKRLKAFTLVELIIVITILAILATIAFVSFQNYTKDARDSTRVTTLKNIESGLQTFQITTGSYPEPENITQILSNSVIVGYQGYIGDTISKIIKLNKTPIDPIVGKYIYSTNIQKNKYQILTYLEKQVLSYDVLKTYAFDYSQFQPISFGDKIGIILNLDNSNISQSTIDVSIISNEYKAIFGKKTLVGTGKVLQVIKDTMSNKTINLLGDNCCTFEDNTLNGFQLYVGGIPSENIYTIKDEFNSINSISKKVLHIKTSTTLNGGGTYGGVYMSGINLTTLTPGLDYTVSYNAKMLSPNTRMTFSFQNGSGDENCLSHSTNLSYDWKTYSYSCKLNILKGNLYIRGNQSTEFQIDDIVIQPSVLMN